MNQKDHWEQVYSDKQTKNLGWYTPHLQTSLSWIKELELGAEAPIIDVGGGASTLVGDLLDANYRSITVLDISARALSSVKASLGKKAELVNWLEGDITLFELPSQYYELWHDRAVFHFLTEPELQRQYRDKLLNAMKPGGHLIIGTFATEAPPRCSGLPVQRYSQEQLESTLGAEFKLKQHKHELHITPGGVEQMYLYCHFRRIDQ
jgi:SAM-dependent methyltransferase